MFSEMAVSYHFGFHSDMDCCLLKRCEGTIAILQNLWLPYLRHLSTANLSHLGRDIMWWHGYYIFHLEIELSSTSRHLLIDIDG